MASGQGAVMTGIHGLQHIQGLSATDLAYHDAVRTHTQGRLNQILDSYTRTL